MAHAEVYAEAYAEAYAKVYADAKAKGQSNSSAGIHADSYAKLYANACTETSTNTKAKLHINVKAKSYPEAYTNAKAKAKAEAYAKVRAEAYTKAKLATTSLHSLATDCLRLSIHFFHPIEQCAQQVYHTAIPLSPTSSQLRLSCLQSVMSNQLSCVASFTGAPSTWGSLLRTINVRPRQLTCITTSLQMIIAACGDIVNIYDAVTFMLQQSLHAPETVTKIQDSPDRHTLYLVHSFSVTMWDMQTGGLIHTFHTQSKINDIAASMTGVHIACGLSDGSVTSWNTNTKEEGRGFGNGQPVITIYWLSPAELAVATQNALYLHNIDFGETSHSFSIPGSVWGMVYLVDTHEFLVGTSRPGVGVGQELYSFEVIERIGDSWERQKWRTSLAWQSPMRSKRPTSPIVVGKEIVCITPPNGVHSFDTKFYNWANNPSLLDTATAVAVSLHRNLVAQTKDSIQIFSLDVLTNGEARNDVRPSHVYPLGERHIICILQPTRRLTLLELETLRELRPDDETSPFGPLLANQKSSARASFGHGLVGKFDLSVAMKAWRLGTPLPGWTEAADDDGSLSGLSPDCTRVITVYRKPRHELRIKDVKDGSILARHPLADDHLKTGKVYGLTFDSDSRFYLKIEGPGLHVQIPHDIIASPSGRYSHTITGGKPVLLSEPRATLPYTLDTNCEWVHDIKLRKICWLSSRDIRRGDGGHFWAGQSLVMVGDDGVVRKLTFKEPDC
jgi:WD40 repeat protein